VTGLALAQSTVQVYGNVRALFIPKIETGVCQRGKPHQRSTIPALESVSRARNSSGAGNSAWFQIEQNIGPDSGGGTFGTRNTGSASRRLG